MSRSRCGSPTASSPSATTGPGIAEEDVPHVFERFYRATSARSMPGSGLGLAIVHQVAESHGGTIEVEAAPGGGTLMRLRLPATSGASSQPFLVPRLRRGWSNAPVTRTPHDCSGHRAAAALALAGDGRDGPRRPARRGGERELVRLRRQRRRRRAYTSVTAHLAAADGHLRRDRRRARLRRSGSGSAATAQTLAGARAGRHVVRLRPDDRTRDVLRLVRARAEPVGDRQEPEGLPR